MKFLTPISSQHVASSALHSGGHQYFGMASVLLRLSVSVTICCACVSSPQATPAVISPPPVTVQDEPVPVISLAGTPDWPPKPLSPLPQPVGDGREGVWRSVSSVVDHNLDAPPLMFQTTLRHLKKKPRKAPGKTLYDVEVLVWDPEQVDLRLMAGPREPEAPLRRRGKGLIPRDPAILPRLLAAFNGGWRTQDAKTSGIKWDGVQGLPLGNNLATIMLDDDRSVRLGTWAGDKGYDDLEETHSYRQNIEPLFAKGAFNPLNRNRRWGGTGGINTADGPFTVRSGLCRTSEGYIAYLWGQHINPELFAEAMKSARCDYGMHLDMNGAHAGLEFYRITRFVAKPRGIKPIIEYDFDRLSPKLLSRKSRYLAERRSKDFFYLLRAPALPRRLGPLALKPLPQPGSLRHAPAGLAGANPSGVRALVWDTARLLPSNKSPETEGGLQVILSLGGATKGATVAFGDSGVSFEASPLEAPLVARGDKALRILGVNGTFAACLEAPASALDELEAVRLSWPGASWVMLPEDASCEVATLAADRKRWVRYDGVTEAGKGLSPTQEGFSASRRVLVFGLGKELPLVRDLKQ